MTAWTFGRAQKAAILAPLTALSAFCTASLLTVGSPVGAAGAQPATLPDGAQVPTTAIQAPATVPENGYIAPGVPNNMAQQAISTASVSGIPEAALTAYQRAATIINAAAKGCQAPWQLLAAIGRVESDHGRADNNTLSDSGLATPGIFGPELNGKNGTQRVMDTDGGQYDHDTVYDRAVGPMQFIPSTWTLVGVDANNDGQRNPQDINDAALATAVYLCSGHSDLSTLAGQQAAVFRYNHSSSYVSLVLSIMRGYESGDFASVPNNTTSTGFNFPVPPVAAPHAGGKGHRPTHHKPGHHHAAPTPGGTTAPPAPTPTAAAPSVAPPAPAPSNPLPTKLPTSLPTQLPSNPVPSVTSAIGSALTKAQATTQCLAQVGAASLTSLALDPAKLTAFNTCMAKLGFPQP